MIICKYKLLILLLCRHSAINAGAIHRFNVYRNAIAGINTASADFFNVEKFPTLIFKSTKVTEAALESAKLNGLLTIHGVEKPVVFGLQIHGVAKDPWGNVRAAFTATTKINRKDFGLNWNQVVEAGQLLVGEEVMITLEVEGILKS